MLIMPDIRLFFVSEQGRGYRRRAFWRLCFHHEAATISIEITSQVVPSCYPNILLYTSMDAFLITWHSD